MSVLSFDNLAKALEHSRGLRSVVDYIYRGISQCDETETFLVQNVSQGDLPVVALPARVMELQIGMSVEVNGKVAPVVPSGIVASLVMGTLAKSGSPDELVRATGRAFAGGQQRGDRKRTLDEEADLSRFARAIGSVRDPGHAKALRTMLRRANSDKYVPFVVPETPLKSGQMVVVKIKRGHQSRYRFAERLRSAFLGRFRVRQKLHVGGRYSTHLYITPPPGSYIVAPEVPPHWPASAARSTRKGNLWHLYLGAEGKRKIWESRDETGASPHEEEWYATAEFSTQPLVHSVLAIAFATLTLGSVFLGVVEPDSVPTRLMPLNALVGSMILPLVWNSRENDLQLTYLGFHALVAALLAVAWLVVHLQALPSLWLVLVGAAAVGKEGLLAWRNRGT